MLRGCCGGSPAGLGGLPEFRGYCEAAGAVGVSSGPGLELGGVERRLDATSSGGSSARRGVRVTALGWRARLCSCPALPDWAGGHSGRSGFLLCLVWVQRSWAFQRDVGAEYFTSASRPAQTRPHPSSAASPSVALPGAGVWVLRLPPIHLYIQCIHGVYSA